MDTKVFTKQLKEIIEEYSGFLAQSQYKDASDVISKSKVQQMITRSSAAIERATGKNSVYFKQTQDILRLNAHSYDHLAAIIGIVESVKFDIESDYMVSFEELIHSDVFSDFLEMSEYLLDKGYKDASAVIAGSTLEAHIKQLCLKHNIELSNNNKKPKKADTLNAELVKATAYSKLEQKNITAWLGLRNDAAHGNYNEYDRNQVGMLISSISEFIVRNPA